MIPRKPKVRRRPFVLVNMSMTADGKIATADRGVTSFGSARDQAHLYELRATADAVMCGARTVESGRIHLGVGGAKYRRLRLRNGLAESNLRVLVSGSGSLDPRAAVFQARFSPILVLTTRRASRRRLAALRGVAEAIFVSGERHVDFAAAFAWLDSEWGVRRLLCEGGGELNAALFAADLVDELHLTICPFVFAGRSAPAIAGGVGVRRLADAAGLRLKSWRRVGQEMWCVFERR